MRTHARQSRTRTHLLSLLTIKHYFMCLYPKLFINPKYKPNKKNNYNPPICTDKRLLYVPIACGVCYECMQKKAREWKVRLNEEMKLTKYKDVYFVTLTFSNEELQKLCNEKKTQENNYIATLAVRRFLERYRKEFKKSFKHFLITEMGGENTERIHLHGFIWGDPKKIEKHWKYGIIDWGKFVDQRSIGYIVKYITKIDQKHKNYRPIILCSKGIGRCYIEKSISNKNKYKENNKTNENYTLNTGQNIQLPIYYRNHIYTEEEREKLWIEKLEKQERWILGQKIDISTKEGINKYLEILKNAQDWNKKILYGDDKKEWKKKEYNVTIQEINKLTKESKKNKKFNKL